MKVKLKDLKSAEIAISKLINCDLPVKIAFQISKFAKEVNENLKTLEEQRIKLIRKYGTTVDDKIEVARENYSSFIKDYNEILDQEIEIQFEPLSINDLGNISMTALEIASLSAFING